MAIVTKQRFISGLKVFDTYAGQDGTIVLMNLDDASVHPIAPLYTGTHFLVMYADSTLQLFTIEGRRIDHTTGVNLPGITLLTAAEKTALMGAGYPVT